MALDRHEIKTVVKEYLTKDHLCPETKSLLSECLNENEARLQDNKDEKQRRELTLELGYWLAHGALTPSEFGILARKISQEPHKKWSVLAPGYMPDVPMHLYEYHSPVLDESRPILESLEVRSSYPSAHHIRAC
jgi:hypothetical protein